MTFRRRDNTHKPMVSELRKLGFSVLDLGDLGSGTPDFQVGRYGLTLMVEAKTPKNVRENSETAKGQKSFAETWQGCPVIRAFTTEDVLFNFGLLQKRHGWTK